MRGRECEAARAAGEGAEADDDDDDETVEVDDVDEDGEEEESLERSVASQEDEGGMDSSGDEYLSSPELSSSSSARAEATAAEV